eukprot:8200634-Alexandrium_andersonii.AAC.1
MRAYSSSAPSCRHDASEFRLCNALLHSQPSASTTQIGSTTGCGGSYARSACISECSNETC